MRTLTVVLASVLSIASAPGAQRNVLFLVSDDHGLELGCYGHPVIRTPSLDRLAARGIRFTNAFATVASCSASRSVLYTGMFNHSNGQYGHAHSYHNLHTFDHVRTLPRLMADAGYRTAIVSKFHVKPASLYPFENIGVKGGGRNVIEMARAARRFIEADANAPFFVVIGYVDPHRARVGFGNGDQYTDVTRARYKPEEMIVPPFLPDSKETREELAEYAESVTRMDQGVGAMLDVIAETGHAGDTLIVYLSDNGIAFPGAKTTLYEPGVHLPLLISSPTQKNRGVVNQAMVSWVDIAPTVLDWAGVEVPEAMAGRSLLPILEQEQPAGWDEVFGSHTFHEITMYYPMRMIRTRRYKYILNLAHQLPYPFASDLWASPTWQGVLKRGDTAYGKRTIEAYINRPREELYDLETDPDEVKNLAGDPAHADVRADLRQRLQRWQKQTKDPWIVKYEYE